MATTGVAFAKDARNLLAPAVVLMLPATRLAGQIDGPRALFQTPAGACGWSAGASVLTLTPLPAITGPFERVRAPHGDMVYVLTRAELVVLDRETLSLRRRIPARSSP